MIKTVQEGMEKFKKALKGHKRYLDRIRRVQDESFGKGNWNMGTSKNFFVSDAKSIYCAEEQIDAMARVLGITKSEWRRVAKECGVDKDIDGEPADIY